MIINPSLLTHPNIPKPLHGTAPRTILGEDWWNEKRQMAYDENDYHCQACGAHKSQDRFHNWLEAHEDYSINYSAGKVKLNKIVALCHTCHNFIHSGRLGAMYRNGSTPQNKVEYILKRGFWVLKKNNLEPFWGTALLYTEVFANLDLLDRVEELKEKQEPRQICQDWSKWHIEIDGINHYGKFKSLHEWRQEYKG